MARIIKAKYPKVGSKYVDYQGYGSGNNGNTHNVVSNINERNIVNDSDTTE